MPVSSTTSSARSAGPSSMARPPCGGLLEAGVAASCEVAAFPPQPARRRARTRTNVLVRIPTRRRVNDRAALAHRPAMVVIGEPDIAHSVIGEYGARRQ